MKVTKQLWALTCLLMLSSITNAQNTFPSSGNVGIGTLSPTAPLEVAGAVKISGTDNLPATTNTNLWVTGNIGSPTLGKIYIGAGTGWDFRFAKRSLNVDTDLFTFYDNGNMGMTGNLNVQGLGNTIIAGNVGIGTIVPEDRLHVQDVDAGVRVKGSDRARINLQTTTQNGWQIEIGETNSSGNQLAGDLGFTESGVEGGRLILKKGGNVGIGYMSPSEKLSVNGNIKANGDIKAKKVIVTQSGWPDYVFHPSYKLMPLSEIAYFIENNQHLPDVPSAKEIEEKGVSLGDNQALLLKKIEELTLYILQQQKQIDELRTAISKNK